MKQVLKNIIKIAIVVIFIVVIVKLGIGIYLYCKAQQVINTAEINLTGLSTDLQNNELLKYEGEIRGSQVRKLMNSVEYSSKNWPVSLTYAEGSINTTEGIKSGAVYLVSFEKDEQTGYVTSVMIVKKPVESDEGDEF